MGQAERVPEFMVQDFPKPIKKQLPVRTTMTKPVCRYDAWSPSKGGKPEDTPIEVLPLRDRNINDS
jgi:hypothetical protein